MNRSVNINSNFRGNKKLIWVFVLVIIGIALLATIFMSLIWTNRSESIGIKKDDDSNVAPALTTENNRDNQARAYIAKGNPVAAIEVFQKYINSAKSNETKSEAYITRSSMLYQYYPDEYKKQILEDAYMAEELLPNIRSATLIYDMESNYGNQQAAEKYSTIRQDRMGNEEVGE